MKGRRKPAPATAERLEEAACNYLARYAASTEGVRRVLRRRVLRSVNAHGGSREDGFALVEEVLAKLARTGLLDDDAFAKVRAQSLLRQGRATRAARARLLADGVAPETAAAAVAEAATETAGDLASAELAAAIRTARRRRLGPFGTRAHARAERRQKDLASLARAGFPLDVARAVIDAEDEHALDQLLTGGC